MTIHYVGYPVLDGFANSYPEFFASIREASEWLSEHGDRYFLGYDDQRDLMNLYRVTSDDDIESAKEFAGVGCPFDYPSARIEFGPRGGIRRVCV